MTYKSTYNNLMHSLCMKNNDLFLFSFIWNRLRKETPENKDYFPRLFKVHREIEILCKQTLDELNEI